MSDENNVLVLVEEKEGDIQPVSFELLGVGDKIAEERGEDLCAVLLGSVLGKVSEKLTGFTDKVYTINDSALESFQSEIWTDALTDLCEEVNPAVFLLAHTYRGMDLGPRLSFRLETELTTDCLELSVNSDSGLLERTKQIFGGNVEGVFVYEDMPQLVTVRPKVMEPLQEGSRDGEIVEFDVDLDESEVRTSLVEKVEEEAIRLDEADAIVSGGRGVDGEEGFEELEELIELLGESFEKVELGSSRPPVDLGLVHSDRQVGLTREKVSPDLYIAVGISGATQHLVGMSNSGTIVAINKDPNATIFENADYGVVGEYEEVLPAFVGELRDLL